MSAPVRMESPLCRCDRPAVAVHAALCPNPRHRSQRLPSTAAAHAARCAQAYAADRRQHRGASPRRSRAAVRRCPCAGPGRACGDVRGVCPILVLVNRLQKENTA